MNSILHNWIGTSSYSEVPSDAVLAGSDSDGDPIYVGRARHADDLLPAKVIPNKRKAYVSYDGEELEKYEYEILCGDLYQWQSDSGGHIPPHAMSSGITSSGELLYIGRGEFAGSMTPGKIHPSHGCLYIPYGGGEHRIDNYEVLVLPEIWLPADSNNIPPHAVLAGTDTDGDTIYVGRAEHNGDLIPAKVIINKNCAYICHSGHEHIKHTFEVLVGYGYGWIPANDGNVPPNTVEGGKTIDDETLYIGRGEFRGSVTPGKIHPSHGCLYIPYGGQEIKLQNYEALSFKLYSTAHNWVSSSKFEGVPPEAVLAGHDSDGDAIYAGRAHHENDLLPAKIVPNKHKAYVAYGGEEHEKSYYEILCGDLYQWVPAHGGHVPANAMATGVTADGETLYIGRGEYAGSVTPGKVHPSHGCLYIPYGGREHRLDSYEVLTLPEVWLPAHGRSVPPHAVFAGVDSDGDHIFVGKAYHDGDLLPAKVIINKNCAYVCHGGREHVKHEFEVLVGYGYGWEPAGHGSVAPNSVEGGRTDSGETLYIGRGNFEGSLTPGKIHPSHGCLYIPYGGQEIRLEDYECLVRKYY
ncbi:uncharacterized protein LOC129616083 [Condylostylus longicornis]|uniref:uncharacterized protein LOC129616083 n=1 Tax=Condylostylus longicornis TaxID=2530218 RepID=UPI00244E5742|nr:uncharacterized protein LOC129616083 [Condylostylus longicornis]